MTNLKSCLSDEERKRARSGEDIPDEAREYLMLRGWQPSPDGAGEVQWRDPEYKEATYYWESALVTQRQRDASCQEQVELK